jgi:SAM-dependent methyltransferase
MADPAVTPWTQGAADWADVMEGQDGWGVPVYRHVLDSVDPAPGARSLDVGCGAGRFCRLAADRGLQVSGLDATAAYIEIARVRVPDGDIAEGQMQELPYADETFDLVTGFNSFFIAPDMAAVLREAGRVARPGGMIATTVFGRPDRCDSTALFGAVRGLFPAAAEGSASPGRELHEEGVLEEVAAEAGLTVSDAGYFSFAENYADPETLARGMMAAPPMVRAAGAAGADVVRATLLEAAAPFTQEDGRVRLDEEVRYLIASA